MCAQPRLFGEAQSFGLGFRGGLVARVNETVQSLICGDSEA
jgi:hypothetical protein